VAIGNENHGGIATMPIALAGLDQPLDLTLGQVATYNCEALVLCDWLPH
jgi:hypothetical protein